MYLLSYDIIRLKTRVYNNNAIPRTAASENGSSAKQHRGYCRWWIINHAAEAPVEQTRARRHEVGRSPLRIWFLYNIICIMLLYIISIIRRYYDVNGKRRGLAGPFSISHQSKLVVRLVILRSSAHHRLTLHRRRRVTYYRVITVCIILLLLLLLPAAAVCAYDIIILYYTLFESPTARYNIFLGQQTRMRTAAAKKAARESMS